MSGLSHFILKRRKTFTHDPGLNLVSKQKRVINIISDYRSFFLLDIYGKKFSKIFLTMEVRSYSYPCWKILNAIICARTTQLTHIVLKTHHLTFKIAKSDCYTISIATANAVIVQIEIWIDHICVLIFFYIKLNFQNNLKIR